MPNKQEIDDFVRYMMRDSVQPSHSFEEMAKLSQLIIESASEKDGLLKPKTSKLAKELGVVFSIDERREGLQLLSKEASNIALRYSALSYNRGDSFILSNSDYKDIESRLKAAANSVEQVREARDREMMAKACIVLQKPVCSCSMTALLDKDGNEIKSSELKNGKTVSLDRRSFLIMRGNNGPALIHQPPSEIKIGSFYEKNGGWMIETDNMVYTNVGFDREYKKAMIEYEREAAKFERKGDLDFVKDRQAAISKLQEISGRLNTAERGSDSLLVQHGATKRGPNNSFKHYHDPNDVRIKDHLDERGLITDCIKSDIPIIQTDASSDHGMLIDCKEPDQNIDYMNFVNQLPVPGETIHLPPSSRFLDAYQGFEEFVPDLECVVLEVSGNTANYTILTDCGLLTSRDFESVIEQMRGEKELELEEKDFEGPEIE